MSKCDDEFKRNAVRLVLGRTISQIGFTGIRRE
jgi:hypothetical protein